MRTNSNRLGRVLRENIRRIVRFLPEVEPYAVSVGLPSGVSVTVTFVREALTDRPHNYRRRAGSRSAW